MTLTLRPYQAEGVAWLRPRRRALLADDMGLGKRLAFGTPILTPSGWTPIESLSPGDLVIGQDGSPHPVTRVHVAENRPFYRLTFSDGASIDADDEHLWRVQHVRNDSMRRYPTLPCGRWRVMTTADLVARGVKDKSGNRNWRIPTVDPVEYESRQLPADPYTVGVALGDGSNWGTESWEICTDVEILRAIGVEHPRPHKTCGYTGYGTVRVPLLGGGSAAEKRVPEEYLRSSPDQRLALLQGLMDSDGYAMPDGGAEFSSTSLLLVDAVVELTESLGGIARGRRKADSTYTHNGEKRRGLPAERVNIKLPAPLIPFRLKRKADSYVVPTKYQPTRIIAEIERIENGPGACIAVDSPDHLYVAKRHIVTHNTPQALCALPSNVPVLVIAPAVVKYSWANEAAAWRPDYRVDVLSGVGSFRWPDPGEILITTFGLLPLCVREVTLREEKRKISPAEAKELKKQARKLPKPHPRTVIVADEAHRLSNNKTNQTLRFRALRTKALNREGRCWGLTGTPLLNRPRDLWNLITSLGLAREFGSWPWFCEAFNAEQGTYGIEWGKPNYDMLLPALSKIAKRRLKKHVLPELPEKIYRTIPIELGDNNRRLCDAAIEALEAAGVNFLTASVEAIEMAAGGLSFETLSRARAALADAKTEAALDIVADFEEQDTPLVVMSDHRRPVEAVAKREGWGAIHGDVSAADRARVVERFQAGELRGVALTIAAGGVGITLTRASNVLRVDRNWTPALNVQAEDRCHRFGQTRGVVITDLVADHPLDERIAEVCAEKTELAAAIDRIAEPAAAAAGGI
jgi:hypothetical protein